MYAIGFTVDQGAAWLMLNCPEREDALNETISDEITEAISGVRTNADIRILALRGVGGISAPGATSKAWKAWPAT